MTLASDFVQPPRPNFPRWVRYGSYVPLCAVALPLVKTLELAGLWPRIAARRVKKKLGDFGDYRPSGHDVFACVGFKSGTTWLLQIAVQIAFRGEAEFDHIHSAVPWPDAPAPLARFVVPLTDDSPARRSPAHLRVIKTHLVEDRVPYSPDARYIAMVRDPKDVVVSAYHFLRTGFHGPLMPSVRRFVDVFLSDELPIGAWESHLASYWRVRDRANVLFLTYEDLVRSPRPRIAEIARFMGVDLTPGELDAVVQASSFAQMKRLHHKFDPPRVVPWASDCTMIRSGRSGTSRELLSAELQRRIDDHCRAQLERLGCDFPYEQAFGSIGSMEHLAAV